MYRVIPKNATTVARITATLPDGRSIVTTHYRASAKRSTPIEWVVQTEYLADGKRGKWFRRQFTGVAIAKLPAELAEMVRILRDADAQLEGVPSELEPQQPAQPETCDHQTGQPGCLLDTCWGIPVDVGLTESADIVTEEPRANDAGATELGRAITKALRARLGMASDVTLPTCLDNRWYERPGKRHINAYQLRAGGISVRLLTYESRSALQSVMLAYGALYVAEQLVAGQVSMNRRADDVADEVARLALPPIERALDAAEMAKPPSKQGWFLKSPPVGSLLETGRYGRVTVVESRIGGCTLVVEDAEGREQYVDRAQSGWWTVQPAPEPAPPPVEVPAAVVVGSTTSRDYAGCPVCGDTVKRAGYGRHARGHAERGETPLPGVPSMVNTPAELLDAVAALRDAAEPAAATQAEPEVDRTAVAADMDRRIGQALMDGDLDTAETMLDAAVEYEPGYAVPGYGSWKGVREEIAERRRVRGIYPRAYMPPEPVDKPASPDAVRPVVPVGPGIAPVIGFIDSTGRLRCDPCAEQAGVFGWSQQADNSAVHGAACDVCRKRALSGHPDNRHWFTWAEPDPAAVIAPGRGSGRYSQEPAEGVWIQTRRHGRVQVRFTFHDGHAVQGVDESGREVHVARAAEAWWQLVDAPAEPVQVDEPDPWGAVLADLGV